MNQKSNEKANTAFSLSAKILIPPIIRPNDAFRGHKLNSRLVNTINQFNEGS